MLNFNRSDMVAVESNGTTPSSLAVGDMPQVAVASESGRLSTVLKPSFDHWQQYDKG